MNTKKESQNKITIDESSMNSSESFHTFIVPDNQIVFLNDSNKINTVMRAINSYSFSNDSIQLFNCKNLFPKDHSDIPNFDNLESKLRKNPNKNTFSPEEDKYLLSLVKSFGENDWGNISKYMKQKNYERNIRQCKDRYYHYLDPKISHDNIWTNEEDEYLLKKVNQDGKKWKTFEVFFPSKTEVSIRNRYNRLIRKKDKIQRKIDIMSDNFSFLDSYYDKKKKNDKEANSNDNTILHQKETKINNYTDFVSINNSENQNLSNLDSLPFIEDNVENFYDINDSFFI